MKAAIGTSLLLFSLSIQGLSSGLVSEAVIQKAEDKHGGFVRNRFLAFNRLMESAKASNELEQLSMINDFYNHVPYMSDQKNWKQKDYWATPLEFLSQDRGDCEDYVIAKFFALKSLGIDSEKLFLTYVKSSRFDLSHMVLSYFEHPDADPLILDNTNFKIFPASQRNDLTPIYLFNGDSLYLARKKGKKIKVNTKTHKKWDTLLQDIQRNKL